MIAGRTPVWTWTGPGPHAGAESSPHQNWNGRQEQLTQETPAALPQTSQAPKTTASETFNQRLTTRFVATLFESTDNQPLKRNQCRRDRRGTKLTGSSNDTSPKRNLNPQGLKSTRLRPSNNGSVDRVAAGRPDRGDPYAGAVTPDRDRNNTVRCTGSGPHAAD